MGGGHFFTSILTFHPKLHLAGCNASVILSHAAVHAHIQRPYSGNDQLMAALLVFIDHIMVVFFQHFPIFEPAYAGRGFADDHTVKAHRVSVWDFLVLELGKEDWGCCEPKQHTTERCRAILGAK